MTRGTITKVVKTHGSLWGFIQPQGSSHRAFFNAASFDEADGFDAAEEGLLVEFDEEKDPVNGFRAMHLAIARDAPTPVAS
jgi:hypothetical protein